jgi:hypothetical protein
MRKDVKNWISESGICQKTKYQRDPYWQDALKHHLYLMKPLASLSIDTLGSLPEDENVNSYVIVIVDNFTLLQWVGIFSIPEEIRTDGGTV